jgi:Predicted Zn-dependent protease (DUF2268)
MTRIMSIIVITLAAAAGCAPRDVRISYLRSDSYMFTRTDRVTIDDIANATASEVRQYLPSLPQHLEITVRSGTDVIEEIGATAAVAPPADVVWTVDPSRYGGVAQIAKRHLRATLFHEFHHLVRSPGGNPRTIVDHAVLEGMATAFERDFAGAAYPWAQYPKDEIEEWAKELLALPADAPVRDWLFGHSDGRRWIGFRVGTYWVDQAIAKSGRSSVDLVSTPTRQILSLAKAAR